jgi:hypothetical protein
MSNLIPGMNMSALSGLPMPVKGAMGIVTGGGILGFVYYVTNGDGKAMLIVGVGMVAVILLLMAYKKVLGFVRKAKAHPLTQGLAGNAAAAPQGISEPARRARLDDLRRNFDQGVEKFRAAGKNLYSVPWYVLVGEPGSGKTEAIRHCNVGFPPGLQDQLQGAGGTLNMNWWFTNQAIILDTAGRLMFEEVVPGSTNEWSEFLKLLKTNRPNCPINGILLVIPVDTLIKDSADSIEKKAGKIAQQFDQIQRTLGVRFPVFIIITKCDLLNGFREFFDDLNDPQLQHQIMGWSNPGALDQKFDPKAVVDHMENVKKRLTDRRQQLLLDPINTEDAQGRRIDQVDALYALPDSLTKIAPRLRRYLEMVFVAGEWSPKPLFLRGIYFTSSMTEGSALDAELAEVLGVPVDSLPEGRVWRRDRAYFLRDLFIEKVFREKGLVTRADNADKQQRGRRAIVLAFGFLAVIVVGVLAWLGSMSLKKSIGGQSDFWTAASKVDMNEGQIIDLKNLNKDKAYKTDEIIVGKGKMTRAELFSANLKPAIDKISIPIIFRPMTFIGGNVDTDRIKAYRALYERCILYPLYVATRNDLAGQTAATWNDGDTAALEQLMKAEYADATQHQTPPVDPSDHPHPQVNLDPIFHLVLTPADYTLAQKDLQSQNANLQVPADTIYKNAGAAAWPAKAIQADSPDSIKAVHDGVNNAIAYWKGQATDKNPALESIFRVQKALDDFRDADDKLQQLKAKSVTQIGPYTEFTTAWDAAIKKLNDARTRASDEWASATKGRTGTVTLASLYTGSMDDIVAKGQQVYVALLKLTPDQGAKKGNEQAFDAMAVDRQQITAAQTALAGLKTTPDYKTMTDSLSKLDEDYLAMVKGNGGDMHRFEVQAQLYNLADKLLPRPPAAGAAPPPAQAPATLGDALSKVDGDVKSANDTIDKLVFQTTDKDSLARAGVLSRDTIDAGARYRRAVLINSATQVMPTDSAKWGDYVKSISPAFPPDHLLRPEVPAISADKTFNAAFSPDAAGAVTDAVSSVEKLSSDPSQKVLDAPEVASHIAGIRKGLDGYLAGYRGYWGKDCFGEMHFAARNWTDFTGSLSSVREKTIRSALEEYGSKAMYALQRVGDKDGQANLTAQNQLFQSGPFQDDCGQALGKWKDLNADPRIARATILAMDPKKDFLDKYTVETTAKANENYIARYWTLLPLEGLRVLAADGQKDIHDGLATLAKYQRFPLAPPTDKGADLSAADVVAARAALDQIRGALPSIGGTGDKSVGQGGITGDKPVDDRLDDLRGHLGNMGPYLDSLQRFFPALPSKTQPTMSVSFSVVKDAKLSTPTSISQKYTYMLIDQAGKELREAYFGGNVDDTVSLAYPGGDLTLSFRDVTKGPIKQTITLPGPWAPFRLIKDPSVTVVERKGTKWTLEYSVKDSAGKVWVLPLQLDFTTEVPDVKDWPTPP